MPRLTKRLIDTTHIPAKGDTILWDTDIRGFGCRIWPSGRRLFFVRYRSPHGRRRYTLGPYGVLTVEEARTRAARTLAAVHAGEDPAGAKRAAQAVLDVSALANRYLAEYAAIEKKPRSVVEDRRNLNKHILPLLGKMPITAVTAADINKLRVKLRQTPYAANRCRALLSTMFNLAETWGLRPRHSNPILDIPRYKEQKRKRFLTLEELSRLGAALDEAEEKQLTWQSVVPALRLLLLTGARRNEILTLRWDDVQSDRLMLRDTKTGTRPVYLSDEASMLLQSLPRTSEWVFPGQRRGTHLTTIQHAWKRISKAAGLPADVRIHDLRHTYGSLAAQSGVNLLFIATLLGHENMATTERYTHSGTSPVQHAARTIGKLLGGALSAR